MDIRNLTARDRAVLLGIATAEKNDPVALILEKAQNYDEATELIRTNQNLPGADKIDLLTMVQAMLIGIDAGNKKIREQHARIKQLLQERLTGHNHG